MTNEEKYKTQSERATAFTAFCKRFRFCKNCPARVQYTADTDIISDMDMHCHFKWLTLEYKDEEKPLPCPCCGATAMVREMPQSCGFKWEIMSAAQEAYDRMTYMGGIEDLPPMVQDAYAILQEGLEHERKIKFNNEKEGGAE